jgi:fructose/tagatose bisphosphate aldolase
LTDPQEVVKFIDITDVDALAVAIGTAHGVYQKTPELRIDRLDEITAVCDRPLVLHGGSGIPDDQIKMAIEAGIRKINFGTDVCYSFLDSVFSVDRSVFAIDLFMKEPINAVKDFAVSKIQLLGANGRV